MNYGSLFEFYTDMIPVFVVINFFLSFGGFNFGYTVDKIVDDWANSASSTDSALVLVRILLRNVVLAAILAFLWPLILIITIWNLIHRLRHG